MYEGRRFVRTLSDAETFFAFANYHLNRVEFLLTSTNDPIDQRRMSCVDKNTFATRHVPFAHRSVGTGTDKIVLFDQNVGDVIGVTAQNAQTFDGR